MLSDAIDELIAAGYDCASLAPRNRAAVWESAVVAFTEALRASLSASNTEHGGEPMKSMKGVTVGLWAYLSQQYRTSIVRKGDSEMALVAMFLDNMGIVDRERFLSRYTTTIGQTIYVPFVVGEGDDGALWGQIITAIHEHQHVEQAQRLGFATFATAYLFDASRRAAFEAEAYRTTLEMHRWRFGSALTDDDCDRIAGKLADYACTPEQIEFAAKYLQTSNRAIAAGAIVNEATKRAVDWLNTCAPWLRK